MDGSPVVAIIEMRRYVEYGIHHSSEAFVTAHQADEACRVMEYRPCVMEAVAFREVAAPFERAERLGEGTVLVPADHELVFFIVEIAVVHGSLPVRFELGVGLAEGLAECIDAPVVVCIFKGTCSILVDAYVARHISEPVIILPASASGGADLRMD